MKGRTSEFRGGRRRKVNISNFLIFTFALLMKINTIYYLLIAIEVILPNKKKKKEKKLHVTNSSKREKRMRKVIK